MVPLAAYLSGENMFSSVSALDSRVAMAMLCNVAGFQLEIVHREAYSQTENT